MSTNILKYVFDNYEITMSKANNSVKIRCLDKHLFKIYQKTFTHMKIEEICSVGANNFYTICKNYFDSIVLSENKQIIIEDTDCIYIDVKYCGDLNFEFKMELPLSENLNVSPEQLYIQRLDSKIEELQAEINDIKNDMIQQVTQSTFVMAQCDKVVIKINSTEIYNKCNLQNREFTINFYETQTVGLFSNFKNIKIKILEIHNHKISVINADIDRSIFTNLPKYVEKLVILNLHTEQLKFLFDESFDTKFDSLEIINCPSITDYQYLINQLNLKTLSYTKCGNFNLISTPTMTVTKIN